MDFNFYIEYAVSKEELLKITLGYDFFVPTSKLLSISKFNIDLDKGNYYGKNWIFDLITTK